VFIFPPVSSLCELDRRREHVQKRNEVDQNGDVHQNLIRAPHGLADLADEQYRAGRQRLHDDRDVRRFPPRMNFSKRGGK